MHRVRSLPIGVVTRRPARTAVLLARRADVGIERVPEHGLGHAQLAFARRLRGQRGTHGVPVVVSLVVLAAAAARADAPAQEDAGTAELEPPIEATSDEIIVVTGTRSETPRAASPVTTEVIDRRRLEESGVQTVSEALALRPGLWIERGVAGTSGLT